MLHRVVIDKSGSNLPALKTINTILILHGLFLKAEQEERHGGPDDKPHGGPRPE